MELGNFVRIGVLEVTGNWDRGYGGLEGDLWPIVLWSRLSRVQVEN
jgi:hypothetical protein